MGVNVLGRRAGLCGPLQELWSRKLPRRRRGFKHLGMKLGYSRRYGEELESLISGNEKDFLCRKSSRKNEAG